MTQVILQAQLRGSVGTGAARALRKEGLIPAIIYGNNTEPLAVSVLEKEITKLYRKHGFTSTVVKIACGGQEYDVLPKAIQLHPITELATHVDFVFLAKDGLQKVSVPVVFEGRDRCIGVKRGGFLNIIHRKLELYCPVNNVPQSIAIDISRMHVGSSIKANSMTLPDECKFVRKNNFVIASITGKGGKAGAQDADA